MTRPRVHFRRPLAGRRSCSSPLPPRHRTEEAMSQVQRKNGRREPYRPLTDADFDSAFPASRKVYVDGPHGIRVPMREIALSGGEPPLRVYDTSGPRSADVRDGLPKLRRDWILARGDVEPVDRTDAAAS